MRNILWCLLILTLILGCSKDKCSYDREISFIFINGWYAPQVPHHGIVYSYEKGSGFVNPIDSVSITSFEKSTRPSIFDKDTAGLSCLVCSLIETEQIDHNHDLRIVVDDTLFYDISKQKLSRIKLSYWTMGGPMEWSVVSSLSVNSHDDDNPTPEGSLSISNKFVRIQRK